MRETNTSNTTDVFAQSNLDYTHYNRAFQIYGYICVVLYPSGVILNLISIFVLVKIKIQQTAVGIHMLALGITNTMPMIMGFMYSYPFQELVGIKPTDYVNKIFCRVVVTIGYPMGRAGGLSITSATYERFLSVAFPLHVKSWPMLKASKFISGIISLLCLSEITMWLVVYTEDKCWSSDNSDSGFKKFYQLSFSIFWFVTGGLVFVFSTLIVYFLSIHNKDSTNTVHQRKQRRITVMMFTIAVTFVLSTLSELFSFIISEHFSEESQTSIDMWTATWAAVFLFDFYHWSNFLIYFAFLQKFRSGFFNIFCRKCRSREDSETREDSISRDISTTNSRV